jgi:hypothetical protein
MIWAWLAMLSMASAVVVVQPLLKKHTAGRRWLAAGLVVLLVVVVPAGLYALRGSWQALHRQQAATIQLRSMEQQAATHPGDATAWLQLGRQRLEQGQLKQALDALEQARRLAPDDPDVQSALALALAMEQGSFKGEASALLDKALQTNPQHREALWLAALAARERGDDQATRSLLLRLQALVQPQEPMHEVLQRALAGLSPQAGPDQGATTLMATVQVHLPPGHAATAYAGQRLVVFARQGGQAMPVAASAVTVDHWPIQVTLQRSHTMGPLDDGRPVTVVARLARPEAPVTAPGLLEGHLDNVHLPASAPLTITLEPPAPDKTSS